MFFNKSKIETYKNMWNYMSSTPDSFSATVEEGIDRVKKGGYAFLMESASIQYNVSYQHFEKIIAALL